MKLNLKKLREVELSYANTSIAFNTLQQMMNNFLSLDMNNSDVTTYVQIQALVDLGIIELD